MGFLTTEKGKAYWTYAFTPDTKYKAEGEYKIKLRMSGQEAIDLQKYVDDLYDQSLAEAVDDSPAKKISKANNSVCTECLNEDGAPTGELEFTFKQRAVITKKDKTTMPMRVAVFDAKGEPITEEVVVGNGSTVKVSYEPFKWVTPTMGAGVTLRFKALQVIKLMSRAGGDKAEGFGFGEEDGYSHDNNNNNNSDDNDEFLPETSDQDEDF